MIPSLLDMKIYSESGEAQGTDTVNEQGSSSSHYAHEMMQPNQSIGQTEAVSDGEEDYDLQLRHRLQDQKHDRDHDDVVPSFNFYRDTIEQSPVKKEKSPRKSVRDDSDDENGLVIMDEREDDSSQRGLCVILCYFCLIMCVIESGNEDTPVPSNLPKRQRMLFMRIQNQQMHREAAAKSEEKEGDGDSDDDEEKGGGKDDWYSSDDEVEDNNLTEVLKNLSSTKVKFYFSFALIFCNAMHVGIYWGMVIIWKTYNLFDILLLQSYAVLRWYFKPSSIMLNPL